MGRGKRLATPDSTPDSQGFLISMVSVFPLRQISSYGCDHEAGERWALAHDYVVFLPRRSNGCQLPGTMSVVK